MYSTSKNNEIKLCEKLALDTTDLMQVLSCGRSTAVEIGEAAGARIQIGKRVLWNVEIIQSYLDSIATGNAGGNSNE